MSEIASFNMLFVEAKNKGVLLVSFYQDIDKFFYCSWQRGKTVGPELKRRLPFNAALDSFLAATAAETPAAPETTDDLFG
jgi:hypothetical protein